MKFDPEGYWWGLKPPGDVEIRAAWGARGIIENNPSYTSHSIWTTKGTPRKRIPVDRPRPQRVVFLHDRQQAIPQPCPQEFKDWIAGPLQKWFDSMCGQAWLYPTSDEVFTLNEHPFHAEASPNTSGGYIYCAAWMVEE